MLTPTQAESVSLSLRTPILLHPQPKPGCSPQIIQYFTNQLSTPHTLRKEITDKAERIKRVENADAKDLLGRWVRDVEKAPLLGPLVDADGKRVEVKEGGEIRTKKDGEETEVGKDGRMGAGGKGLEERMMERQKDSAVTHQVRSEDRSDAKDQAQAQAQTEAQSSSRTRNLFTATTTHGNSLETDLDSPDPLKIIVIGDRLMTDTLLAHRLSLHLPPTSRTQFSHQTGIGQENTEQRVISIHTTSLPKPDIPLLRWIEDRWSGRKLKESPTDWGRYVLASPSTSQVPGSGGRNQSVGGWGRWNLVRRIREAPDLRWDPRSWKPLPMMIGFGRGVGWGVKRIWVGMVRGGRWVWYKFRRRSQVAEGALEGGTPSVVEKRAT